MTKPLRTCDLDVQQEFRRFLAELVATNGELACVGSNSGDSAGERRVLRLPDTYYRNVEGKPVWLYADENGDILEECRILYFNSEVGCDDEPDFWTSAWTAQLTGSAKEMN
jgi:hypothetical protein